MPQTLYMQILNLTSFVMSLGWSLLLYVMSAKALSSVHHGHQYAILLAVIGFLLSWAVVAFFTSLLINVIDAVFICFAIVSRSCRINMSYNLSC